MKWFRRHIKTGAQLALFALLVQFVLSFGHFHCFAAEAAPAIQTGLTPADLADADAAAIPNAAGKSVLKQQPSDHDRDQHPADGCAICAVIALATNLLFATPPVLQLPQAIELLYLTTEAEFAHLKSARHAFQSRAPPLS
jgi:hypothetical protein